MSPSTWMTAMPALRRPGPLAAPAGPALGSSSAEPDAPSTTPSSGETVQTVHLGSRSIGAMELAQFCSTSRVIIVAGKGGVGKTTVTATLAAAAARTGMSVLIVEVEGKSGLAAASAGRASGTRRPSSRTHVRGPDPDPRCRTPRLSQNNGFKRISKRLVRSGALDVVADRRPRDEGHPRPRQGQGARVERAADLIIIDAPAAGHALTFLMSAQGLLDAVSGRAGQQAGDRRGRAALAIPTGAR